MSHGNIQPQRKCKNKIGLVLLKIYFGKNFVNNSHKDIMTALPLEK